MWQNIGDFLINQTKFFRYAFNFKEHPLAILDILIVAVIFYWIYKVIKGTRGMKILVGIVILGIALMISKAAQLYTLNWILTQALTVVLIAIPIVFQPELRRALEKLGRARIFSEFSKKEGTSFSIIPEIIEACRIMSKNKIGGLIVIRRQTGLDDYIESGTKIEGQVTSELILNLFFPNSPLHDGAIIIDGDKVMAAGVMLPLADSESFTLGARHRAALGIASETDAVVVVISEQNGQVSLAFEGKLTSKVSLKILQSTLKRLLKIKKGKFLVRSNV